MLVVMMLKTFDLHQKKSRTIARTQVVSNLRVTTEMVQEGKVRWVSR